MNWKARMAKGLMCLMALMMFTGCRYLANRYYDFRDTFDLGVGITAENPVTGIIPPSLGAHVQVTDFLQLGWITHNGYSAETDMRGTFVGPESYTRAGFLMWQYFHKDQDYVNALYYSKFKDKDFLWCTRMESYLLASHGRPAKRLHYEHWTPYPFEGVGLLHQGWQYWGYTGANVAICEPFLTHLGLMVRVGLDPSEMSDFVLGWFLIDFKSDDMLREEYERFRGREPKKPVEKPAVTAQPAPAQPEPVSEALPAPAAAEPPAGAVPAESMRSEEMQPIPELETIYFDFDRSNIRPDQLPRIEKNMKYLKEHTDVLVQVIGHADERGTSEYNMHLGLRRADSVRDYLTENGIQTDRVQTQSRGEEEPADPGHNEAAWAKNRRAEFKRIVVINASPKP
jgi:peptidoglycan-associated lipoprotein